MSTKPFPVLHEFTVSLNREIDQQNTRIENEGTPQAKTVTETTKVTKTVSIPVCFKVPSRMENEEADIVRAVWWTKFVERGVITEALLNRRYTDEGGTLPEDDRKLLTDLQAQFLDTEVKLREAEIIHKDDPETLRALRLRFFELREQISAIHRSQSTYFENTAESKARAKHIEWLVLNMSYFKQCRPDESLGEWEPLFPGKTMEEKLAHYDKLVEDRNEMWMAAKSMLELLATFYSSSGGSVTGEEISDYLLTDTLVNPPVL